MNVFDKTASKVIFVVFYLFSMFSMHSDHLGSYWGNNGTPYMFFRFFLIIFAMSFVTVINRCNTEFITAFVPKSALIITALLIFDYYVTEFSGSQFLYRVWWMAYIIVTLASVFIVLTIMNCENYNEFYRKFWLSFTPLYLFIFYICFLRTPGTSYSINTEFGKGTFLMLKALMNNVHISFEAPLMFFGNLAIFTPLPFILSAISKKLTPPIIMILGFITPFIVEGYQLFLKCGQVDIDDIVLNFAGFLCAFIVYLFIYKYRLIQKEQIE